MASPRLPHPRRFVLQSFAEKERLVRHPVQRLASRSLIVGLGQQNAICCPRIFASSIDAQSMTIASSPALPPAAVWGSLSRTPSNREYGTVIRCRSRCLPGDHNY